MTMPFSLYLLDMIPRLYLYSGEPIRSQKSKYNGDMEFFLWIQTRLPIQLIGESRVFSYLSIILPDVTMPFSLYVLDMIPRLYLYKESGCIRSQNL